MRTAWIVAAALLTCAAAGCFGTSGGQAARDPDMTMTGASPKAEPAKPAPPAEPSAPVQTGMASWYGEKYQGRPTASGEKFDVNKLTAAHRTLAFGTLLKVTNTENGKSVVVRVNDRGPFAKGRVLDLSKAAAEKLDMISKGVVRVQYQVVGKR